MYSAILMAPAYCNPEIKLEKDIKIKDLWVIVNYDTFCRKRYDERRADIHQQQHAYLFLEKASMKYEELCNSLKNDWHKKNDYNLKIVDDAYTLIETFKGNNKLIL